MLDMNSLIGRMKKRLPDPIVKSVDTDFFIDILMSETLDLYSIYYPKLIKGVLVTGAMALKIVDSAGKLNMCTKYSIPITDEDYPYTGIAEFNYFRNFLGGGTYSSAGVIDAVSSRVMSSMNMPNVRFTGSFEAPNIIVIDPPPKIHLDFTVSMYQMRRLEEVKTGYHEWFKQLYECDCKIALYYKFYMAAEAGTFGGVEIKDLVSPFLDYESKRQDLIDNFEKDYFKDPDRHQEIFNYSQLVA